MIPPAKTNDMRIETRVSQRQRNAEVITSSDKTNYSRAIILRLSKYDTAIVQFFTNLALFPAQ